MKDWKPQVGKQTKALKTVCKELLVGGARFGGKSELGRAWLLMPFQTLKDKPDSLRQYSALIIRKNLKDLKRWLRKAEEFYRGLGCKVIWGNSPEIRFDNGAIFYCGHLKDENSYLQYMGDELPRILIEELNQLQSEDNYIKLMGSNRSTIEGLDARVMCNTNPGGPGHVWIKKRWNIKGKPPYKITKTIDPISGLERVFIPMKAEDNPIGMEKDPQYVPWLDSLPGKLKQAWRDGDWSVFSGQYFEDFDEEIHGMQSFQIPDTWELWGGLDYGERNPTCFGLYTYDTVNNKKLRIWQYYQSGKSAGQYAEEIMKQLVDLKMTGGRLPREVYSDPSMWIKKRVTVDEYGTKQTYVTSPADDFIAGGFNVVPANNDRIAGWRNLNKHLKVDNNEGFGYFEDYCPGYADNMLAMIHNEKNVEDLKKCGIDHMADETRYGMMGERGSIKISDFYGDSNKEELTTGGYTPDYSNTNEVTW